jgi:hypothetical protein
METFVEPSLIKINIKLNKQKNFNELAAIDKTRFG